ncbi:hypothetical protein [Natronomonas sp.]|uniref:hypothetical protein n=1 Tax=Natronomonas sp. TaxID=2184060 RepID=UPI002FC37F51
MAHLSRPEGDRSRAQLFLIGGLVLAVVFLGLALVLNSAIYTENIATRGEASVENSNALGTVGEVRRGVDGAIGTANRLHDDHPSQEDSIETTVGEMDGSGGDFAARRGVFFEVEVDGHEHGTRFFQENDGNFTAPNGSSSDWTVAEDVSVREFRMEVERNALGDILVDPLNVTIDDGTTAETVEIGTDGSDIVVELSGETCEATASRTSIDFTAGTVDGRHCPALDPLGDLDNDDVTVDFENGDDAEGTYSLLFDEEDRDDISPDYDSDDVDDDSDTDAEDVIYSTTVTMEYRTTTVEYETELEVAPNALDA